MRHLTMNRTAVEKRNATIQDATLRSHDSDAEAQSDQATAGDVDIQSDQATAGGIQPFSQEYREFHDSAFADHHVDDEEGLDKAFRECLKRIGVSSDDDETSKSSRYTSTSSHRLDEHPKQKRDSLCSKETKNKAAPTSASPSPLPSDLVATILEMAATPIHTIMQMGISSKLVVREVLPKLRHLIIWRSRDLDVQTAIKWLSPSKVAGIDVCSLISLANSSSISSQKYNVEASHKIPFFLSQFPNLKRIYIGGTRRLPVLSMYEPFRCVLPEDHREFHNGLLWALCGAFRSRALSQKVIIDGLVYSGIYCLWSQDRRGGGENNDDNERTRCTFCDAVLDHFPVPMIIRHTVRSRGDSSLCFDERQIYERLMKRSQDLVWKALFDDTIEVLRQEKPPVVSITPSSATRIVNLCSWDLRPNRSMPYWNEILGGFTCISRTLHMVLSYVDGSVGENRFEIFEDNPRPQLRELLTTNVEDRRSIEE